MNSKLLILFLQLMAPLALAEQAQRSQPASLPKQPRALVQSLYQQVMARQPIGIPKGADMKTFAPYLSKALLHRIDLAIACGADWYRQNPDPQLKPTFGWLELGLFSGGDEESTPSSFVVEGTQSQKDGSIRVYVKFTYEEPGEPPWIWHVAAILIRENGQYVVDDVIYFDEWEGGAEARLSAILSIGCNGGRWVGLGENSRDQKTQE
jgi:hypothetical protein